MVQGVRKKEAVKQGKAEDVRRMVGRDGSPVAPPRKLQLQPTKANFPRPFSGFHMTIPYVC
jgi:hypothetical protein